MRPLDRLRQDLRERGAVVVAYSGGVDSAFLADIAHDVLGADAIAVTAVSPSLAPRERRAAATLASERGWRHQEVRTEEHRRPGYIANAPDRCFHCKDTLFEALGAISSATGAAVCVGTNLDDLGAHRPGLAAAAAHGVAQPLVEAGFTKALVREHAAARGLPVASKPATPCLASRVRYGIEVTPERLARIAAAEEIVWALGVTDVRVRDLGDVARIEVPIAERDRLEGTAVLDHILGLGFRAASIDPQGLRSGSMLEILEPPGISHPEDAPTGRGVG